ncbi:MAG: sodium/solute symporter [Phycisphaerae bacterium]|nr:sodium/solute symporter [Phycisphaerae bacterium]
MEFSFIDISVFVLFVLAVIGIGIFKSRKEKSSEDYFLAGRGLSWWLIGFSLIAANISTEQFIGMSGSAAKWLGLAIASYEWMAAITLIFVAFFFLPKFLRSGVFTIPEFLEQRYNATARTLMAFFMVLIYVFVTFAVVVYSGALTVKTLLGVSHIWGMPVITFSCWVIGLLAAVYVASGGLKACAWADLLQGSALMIGGALILYWAMKAFGSASVETIPALANIDAGASVLEKFKFVNADKLHMFLPKDDTEIPWTALVIGLWIPNLYYWGLNQYIMQRTLGAKSLSEGQKGIVFAAGLKLIIPFIIVIPGILAFNLFSEDMKVEAIDTNKNAVRFLKAEDTEMKDFDFAGSVTTFINSNTADPAAGKMAFKFNDDFAQIYPDAANKIVAFNSKMLAAQIEYEQNTQWTAEKNLQKNNEAILAAILEKNATLAEDKNIQISQPFIGYKYDSAFALLIKRLVPIGWRGFVLAALLGAVMSSLASMLNSASTIFTMDVYKKFISKNASQKALVTMGRICVGLFAVIGCLVAPQLDNPKFGGVFKFIQEFQGFISPGILAVFVFGLINRRAPGIAGTLGLILSPIIYLLIKVAKPELIFMDHELAFLDRMAITFFCIIITMWIITIIKPRKEPFVIKQNTDMDLKSSKSAKVFGTLIVIATIGLYIYFR